MRGCLKLFGYLAIGELSIFWLGVPVPGPMVGLLLLLLDFCVNRRADPEVARLFDAFSPHLAVLFVPAGAGVIVFLGLIQDGLLLIVLAVTAGTIATILVTAWAFSFFLVTPSSIERTREQEP